MGISVIVRETIGSCRRDSSFGSSKTNCRLILIHETSEWLQNSLENSRAGRTSNEMNIDDAAPAVAPIEEAPQQAETPFSGPINSISSSSIGSTNSDQVRPGASVDPQSGKLVCNRRGVFAHPNYCGQFIVCAPQSRTQRSLRPFEHHCPAEHIFHDSWGRCRPKSLQSDFGKFCQATES